jgi:peroxiredoxin
MIEQKGLLFDVLHDPGNRVAEAYGLRWVMPEPARDIYLRYDFNVPAANGDNSWSLPMPARYIIDPQGLIRYARVDPDYTRRPEPAETIEHVRGIVDVGGGR